MFYQFLPSIKFSLGNVEHEKTERREGSARRGAVGGAKGTQRAEGLCVSNCKPASVAAELVEDPVLPVCKLHLVQLAWREV